MMTIPANAIKQEVRQLIDAQIETFSQPSSLTFSQLREYHERFEKIRRLCQEMDEIAWGSRERHLEMAS